MGRMRYRYFHQQVRKYISNCVPSGQSALVVGREAGELLDMLDPARGVAIYPEKVGGRSLDWENYEFFNLGSVEGAFDYIVLKDVLGMVPDVGTFLARLAGLCKPDARVIIYSHNYLWRPWLLIAEKLGLKLAGGLEHLLSARDTESVMIVNGFQLISLHRRMLMPLFAFGLGPLVNTIGKLIPFIEWIKLNQFQTFRPVPRGNATRDSLTVCLTCRDERENIEPLVRAIPKVAEDQEILFVEGHSSDGTAVEISRVMAAYPEKNIRLIGQPGKGQGDAIREGFSQARGDIIILLEADMTSPPDNISYIYHSIQRGDAEFIEGSRFVYRLPPESMPRLNYLGNWFFAAFFSWLFGQSIPDVLSGIKAIRKKDFDKLVRLWDTWGIHDPFGDFELLFGAMRLGLKIAWQPIRYFPRPYGQSKTQVFRHGPILARMALKAFLNFRG